MQWHPYNPERARWLGALLWRCAVFLLVYAALLWWLREHVNFRWHDFNALLNGAVPLVATGFFIWIWIQRVPPVGLFDPEYNFPLGFVLFCALGASSLAVLYAAVVAQDRVIEVDHVADVFAQPKHRDFRIADIGVESLNSETLYRQMAYSEKTVTPPGSRRGPLYVQFDACAVSPVAGTSERAWVATHVEERHRLWGLNRAAVKERLLTALLDQHIWQGVLRNAPVRVVPFSELKMLCMQAVQNFFPHLLQRKTVLLEYRDHEHTSDRWLALFF